MSLAAEQHVQNWRARTIVATAVAAILFMSMAVVMLFIIGLVNSADARIGGGVGSFILSSMFIVMLCVVAVSVGRATFGSCVRKLRSQAGHDPHHSGRLRILICGLIGAIAFCLTAVLVSNRLAEARLIAQRTTDLEQLALDLNCRPGGESVAVLLPVPLANWTRWRARPTRTVGRRDDGSFITVDNLYYDFPLPSAFDETRFTFSNRPCGYAGNGTVRIFIALLTEDASVIQNDDNVRYWSSGKRSRGYYYVGDGGWTNDGPVESLFAPGNTSSWPTTPFSSTNSTSGIARRYAVLLVLGDHPETVAQSEQRVDRLNKDLLGVILAGAGVLLCYALVAMNPFVAVKPTLAEIKRLKRLVCVAGFVLLGSTVNPFLVQVFGLLCFLRGMGSENPLPWIMCTNTGGVLLIVLGTLMLPPAAYFAFVLVRSAND